MSAIEILARHVKNPYGQHDGWWECMCGAPMTPEHVIDELRAGGFEVVKLPKSPSEYWGAEHQPQWNHYPYTRVDGDEIEIGARCEHVYRANVAEARIFAADILAAAALAEAAQ